jgi:hypothetical protein
MGVLKESHRFYFIPTSTMGVLSKPEFIVFWADQRRMHSNRKFVVILEDSDAALMTRGSDNREQVSAILNLSDGMLADFLRLQIICTINCPSRGHRSGTAAPRSPALPSRLRPARLPPGIPTRRESRQKIAIGRDYSLAEVFAGHDTEELDRPRIGFAAQPDNLIT